ncbi:MAG: hypothetical protein AAFY71_03445 [Bacteroidota bacterium]
MNLYQLRGPEEKWDIFGTVKEIYHHVDKLGYEGPTQTIEGIPLPSGEGFVIEESYIKRSSSMRLSHAQWHEIDQYVHDPKFPRLNSRVDVMAYALETLRAVATFGEVFALTHKGVESFRDVKDVIEKLPFYEMHDTTPIIAKDKDSLDQVGPENKAK